MDLRLKPLARLYGAVVWRVSKPPELRMLTLSHATAPVDEGRMQIGCSSVSVSVSACRSLCLEAEHVGNFFFEVYWHFVEYFERQAVYNSLSVPEI
jgi:hypothetical protein